MMLNSMAKFIFGSLYFYLLTMGRRSARTQSLHIKAQGPNFNTDRSARIYIIQKKERALRVLEIEYMDRIFFNKGGTVET